MADLNIRLHSSARPSAEIYCPACGCEIVFSFQQPPPFFPSPVYSFDCICSQNVTFQFTGWVLNPTGETPAIESYAATHLLSGLERMLARGEY